MGEKSERLKAYCRSQAEIRLSQAEAEIRLAHDVTLWNTMCESFTNGKIFDELQGYECKYPRNWVNKIFHDYSCPFGRRIWYCYKQKHISLKLKNIKCVCCGDLFSFSIDAILTNTPIMNHIDKYQWLVDDEHPQSHKRELKGKVLLCSECQPIFKRVLRELKAEIRNLPLLLARALQLKIKKYENNNQKHY